MFDKSARQVSNLLDVSYRRLASDSKFGSLSISRQRADTDSASNRLSNDLTVEPVPLPRSSMRGS